MKESMVKLMVYVAFSFVSKRMVEAIDRANAPLWVLVVLVFGLSAAFIAADMHLGKLRKSDN